MTAGVNLVSIIARQTNSSLQSSSDVTAWTAGVNLVSIIARQTLKSSFMSSFPLGWTYDVSESFACVSLCL